MNQQTEQSPLPINYTLIGIGNTYSDCIELNENLKKPEYKELHDWVLQHELKHLRGHYGIQDAIHDLMDNYFAPKVILWQYMKFYFKEKGAWMQSLPCTPHNGGLSWDPMRLWNIFIVLLIFFAVKIWWT